VPCRAVSCRAARETEPAVDAVLEEVLAEEAIASHAALGVPNEPMFSLPYFANTC